MAGTAGFGSIRQAFSHRNYQYYASGNAVSFTGTWMQRIAIGWLAWEMTHSGTWLGAIAAADLIPSIILGPIAGAVADRYDRMKLLKIFQVAALAQSVALVILLILGIMNIWILFGLTVFLGVCNAFGLGVQLALLPSIVPREVMTAAVAFNSVTFNSARFVGPALAGLIMYYHGPIEAIACNSLSFLVFIYCLFQIRPFADERSTKERRGFLADMVDGYRYAATHTGIAAVIILLLAISVFGRSVNEMLAQVSDEMFSGGSGGFATLMASLGVGAVVVGLWLSSRGNKPGLTSLAIYLVFLQALGVMLLPFMPDLFWAMPVMFVLGFASSGAGIASQTLLQLAVDGAMRGRVLSLFGMIFRGGPALGALLIGVASDHFGIETPVFISGALMVAVFAWLWVNRKTISASLEKNFGEPARAPAAAG